VSHDFERELQDRMKAEAAKLDGSFEPAPAMSSLTAEPAVVPATARRAGLRFSLTAASALVLVVALASASLLMQRRPETGPAAPSWSPQTPMVGRGWRVLPTSGTASSATWAPDGKHFDVVAADVRIYDQTGVLVGAAPGDLAAWAGSDRLIVLAPSAAPGGFESAYVATIGYNDATTMQPIPGHFSLLLASDIGRVVLTTRTGGYHVWSSGSLRPAVDGLAMAISRDGALVAAAGLSGFQIRTADDGRVIHTWNLDTGPFTSAAFSPDASHVSLSNLMSRPSPVVLTVKDGTVKYLTPDARLVGWFGNDRVVAQDSGNVWWLLGLDGSAARLAMPDDSSPVSVSSAGSIAYFSGGVTRILGSDGSSRQVASPAGSTRPFWLSWSPDGAELVVGYAGEVVLARP
jgi:hypothetical protein